jgi:mono/diheme cytochrome c family protein
MQLLRFVATFALTLTLAPAPNALAQQSARPGPMQSGRHATPEPASAPAASNAAASGAGAFDPKQMFASVCGWCHSRGGREAGKGPKLMDSPLSDSELAYRIKVGKQGQMPAFGSSMNEQQVAAMVAYIRTLKPEGGE